MNIKENFLLPLLGAFWVSGEKLRQSFPEESDSSPLHPKRMRSYDPLLYKKVKTESGIPDSESLHYAKVLTENLLSGDFSRLRDVMHPQCELLLHKCRTISGIAEIITFWETYREHMRDDLQRTTPSLGWSNCFSRPCIFLPSALVVLHITNGKISNILLFGKHPYGYSSSIMGWRYSLPLSVSVLKRFSSPLDEKKIEQWNVSLQNRVPCLACGTEASPLEWHSFQLRFGRYMITGIMSQCPSCKKIVEYDLMEWTCVSDEISQKTQLMYDLAKGLNSGSVDDAAAALSPEFLYIDSKEERQMNRQEFLRYIASLSNGLCTRHLTPPARVCLDRILLHTRGGDHFLEFSFSEGLISQARLVPAHCAFKPCVKSAMDCQQLQLQEKALQFETQLHKIIHEDPLSRKDELFCTLDSLRGREGYHLHLRCGWNYSTQDGRFSSLYMCNFSDEPYPWTRETLTTGQGLFWVFDDIESLRTHIHVEPSAMGVWQTYLLLNAHTFLPAYGYAAMHHKRLILSPEELGDIWELDWFELGGLEERPLPRVSIEYDSEKEIYEAEVECSYWNDWKGLIRERVTLSIREGRIEEYKSLESETVLPYDCGIRYF